MRATIAGWRIDYSIASARLGTNIAAADIDNDIVGSDQCPVRLEVDFG